MLKIHKSITQDMILAAAHESAFGMDDIGWCIQCGAECGVKPDADKFQCWECEEFAVYGAEQLLIMGCAG